MQSNQTVFQAPIKRRASGTPVINVTFNGTQQFEMIVDSQWNGNYSADGLPWEWWQWLKQRQIPPVPMRLNFPLLYNSIQVGGAFVKDVPVAIALLPELEIGLLGHDFGNYDVTIKRDVVEFHPR